MVYFPELLSVGCRGVFRLPRLYTHLSHCTLAPEMAITVTGLGQCPGEVCGYCSVDWHQLKPEES